MAKKKSKPAGKPDPKSAAAEQEQPAEHPAEANRDGDARRKPAVAIVGIGASAGGLRAFSELLESLTPDCGLTLVLIQHLAPNHPSALSSLLCNKSKLPVVQATEGDLLEVDHVYVIPPDSQMEVQGGKLHLTPRPDRGQQHLPIDYFFRSLADCYGNKAIGVILSGRANDGAEGLRQIKAVGGIAIAQQPETAEYGDMPRAAIATGAVDLVLPPKAIADELLRLTRHPYVNGVQPRRETEAFDINDDQLGRIFQLLRGSCGIDFSHYKHPTIKRRLQRRMALHKLAAAEQYLRYLQQNPGELNLLCHDMLISVTRFFREPESFVALRNSVFPKIVEKRSRDNPIRVWVPGCATGEEPYSVAITLLEYLGGLADGISIQLFATDVSDAAIHTARSGTYPESIAADVSQQRLQRFFSKSDGHYRISKAVRDLCVFARHDLTRDSPFSKLDLIVCRNVLIYLGQPLQRRLMGMFHYALNPTGFLMLGSAESVGSQADLFKMVDKRQCIYRKKVATSQVETILLQPPFPIAFARPLAKDGADALTPNQVQIEANQVLLSKFAPPGVIVDSDLQIVQFRGQTGAWLEPASGEASLNLFKMAREGLLYALRTAMHEARTSQTTIRKAGLHVKSEAGERQVDLEIVPLKGDPDSRHYLVLFEEPAEASGPRARPPEVPPAGAQHQASKLDEEKVLLLQQELASSREYLQSIIEALESANEELQSANEEILSSNEELQSTNEELDTAKEELQSTNEELNTVNEELHARNEELSQVNSDLVNLLDNVKIAVVILTRDLKLRRFTPMAEKVLNLIASDVGRPITHIKPNIDCPDLPQIISEVIEKVEPQSREVQDSQGHWFSLRVRPYKNLDNRIDGVVLTLFDIDPSRRHSIEFDGLSLSADAVVDVIRESVLVLDETLRVRLANRAFCAMFKISQAQIHGQSLMQITAGQWDTPAVRELLDRLRHRDETIENAPIELRGGAGSRALRIDGRRIAGHHANAARLLLAIHETGSDDQGLS